MMEILKYYDKAIAFTSNFAIETASKHKGLSPSGYLITSILIFVAVMVPREFTSLLALVFLSVLLFALRGVAAAEKRRQ